MNKGVDIKMSRVSDRIKGGIFILITVACWSGSAALTKVIFTEIDYDKPFFLMYTANCLNALYALSFLRLCFNKDPENPPKTLSGKNIKLAIILTPCVFASSYLYIKGLELTSIASYEIFGNSTFISTFLLSMLILKTKFSWIKFLCVVAAFGGIILIQLIDSEDDGSDYGENPFLGDMITLGAAFFYALYTVLLKKFIPDDTDFDWFGYNGVFGIASFVLFAPAFFVLHFTGFEEFDWPPKDAVLPILVNALFGTVLPMYTWGRSVVLINPLVSDLGTGLSMPIGLVVSYFLEGSRYTFIYLLGSFLIMGAFIAINVYDYILEKDEVKKIELKESLTESNEAITNSSTI